MDGHGTPLKYDCIHTSKLHTLCYVPDVFCAVDLFPLETSQADAGYVLNLIVTVWSFNGLQKELFMFCQVLAFVYPSIHSLMLIWGNKKLKQAFLSVLYQEKYWLKEQKHSTP